MENVETKTPKVKKVKVVSTAKRGRKVNPLSVRQVVLAERKLREESGEVIKRGRPVSDESVRQARLKERAERAALNGGVVKRGRPAKVKAELPKVVAE